MTHTRPPITLTACCLEWQVHFDSASERAVASVERDYAGYKATIATANVARTIVQVRMVGGSR